MAVVNLTRDRKGFSTEKDNIVIVENLESLRGGRALNVDGYPLKVLHAGHVIIKDTVSGDYKPMPIAVSGAITKQGSLTGGSGYVNAGTYTNVSLTGGSGSGAIATVVVAGGAVISVTITNPGTGYKVGDSLGASAANIGTGGSGFALGIAEVDGSSTSYNSIPGSHEYSGILIASIEAEKPFAGVMVRGTVNEVASPYPVSSIKSAFNTATGSRIRWTSDQI